MATTTRSAPTDTASDETYAGDEAITATLAEESNRMLQRLRDGTDAVVERLQPQIAAVATYARDEPTKALLISAAAGAALMGLIALVARPSRRRLPAIPEVPPSTMSAIRDTALALADRAHSVASDLLGTTQKRASELLGSTQKRAGEAADSATETLSDAWQSLRSQAGPVVDRIRPQLDAVASYARDDPARAALGVATAGAVLLGLLALIKRAQD